MKEEENENRKFNKTSRPLSMRCSVESHKNITHIWQYIIISIHPNPKPKSEIWSSSGICLFFFVFHFSVFSFFFAFGFIFINCLFYICSTHWVLLNLRFISLKCTTTDSNMMVWRCWYVSAALCVVVVGLVVMVMVVVGVMIKNKTQRDQTSFFSFFQFPPPILFPFLFFGIFIFSFKSERQTLYA